MQVQNIFKQNIYKFLIFGLALIALTVFLFFRKEKQPENIPQTASPAVTENSSANVLHFANGDLRLALIKTELIPLSPIPIADELSARVMYDDDVTARVTTSFSGRITELKASAGDTVKVGQILAVIDSPDVGLALAELNKSKADEKRKQLALKRAKELVPGEAISKRDWESIQADYEQARAETARAEQKLKNLNPHNLTINGQKVILASPIDGVVTERSATPSMEVGPTLSAPLFVITNFNQLWLSIDIPESMLGKIKVGSQVSIRSDAYPDQKFNAKIIRLSQVINPNSRRANVVAVIDNSEGKLMPEMFVRASILQSSGSAARVPNQSLIVRGMKTYVFVQKSEGIFYLQEVKLTKRGSEFSFVTEGLTGAEKVVTRGALLLDAEMSNRVGD